MKIIKLKKKFFKFDLKKIIKINFKYFGKNSYFNCFVSSKKNIKNSLSFIEDEKNQNFLKNKGILIMKKKNFTSRSQIITKEPRLFFVELLKYFFKDKINLIHFPKKNYLFQNSKQISKKNLSLSPTSFIGKNVKIGKNSFIGKNVVIYPNCILGDDVTILDNSVIGCFGLGYLKNKSLMPHLGKVIIQDHVTIGANCTIVRGTLEDTIIKKNVKIANNVNIAQCCNQRRL